MTEQKKAYLYALIAVLFWGTVATAMKISLNYFDFLQLLFLSVSVSLLTLFCVLVYQKKINDILKLPARAFLKSAVFGLVNPFIYYIILFKAYTILPAQEAQPLNYTWPIMITLLSIPILKQKIGFKNFVAISISFFGVLIISTHGELADFSFSNPLGVVYGIASALVWALFWIYNTKDERDEISKLFLNFLFGLIYISIALSLFSEFPHFSAKHYFGAAYVGLFEMGLTFIVWSLALKKSEQTSKVSRFIYLVPFISLIVIYFVLDEEIQSSTLVGLVFIIGGLIFDNLKFTKLISKLKNQRKKNRLFVL
ncbi:DMT family transporter [Salinimicrobium sediminilitoris]|uniref:DMT family transporter n=1 Tax=Salinimicrobium sediminilitoris TaxID=2876715 RepID=UPI001E5C2325|nr:DMT family transporter [Salinimicrobium sediminilitoris]MCC8360419.1 DMT family transporter [Salinimicrobium sediminilitoris]